MSMPNYIFVQVARLLATHPELVTLTKILNESQYSQSVSFTDFVLVIEVLKALHDGALDQGDRSPSMQPVAASRIRNCVREEKVTLGDLCMIVEGMLKSSGHWDPQVNRDHPP
jgi:hypothetical protein